MLLPMTTVLPMRQEALVVAFVRYGSIAREALYVHSYRHMDSSYLDAKPPYAGLPRPTASAQASLDKQAPPRHSVLLHCVVQH